MLRGLPLSRVPFMNTTISFTAIIAALAMTAVLTVEAKPLDTQVVARKSDMKAMAGAAKTIADMFNTATPVIQWP